MQVPLSEIIKPLAICLTQTKEMRELKWTSTFVILNTFSRQFTKHTEVMLTSKQKESLGAFLNSESQNLTPSNSIKKWLLREDFVNNL
jgi:hypothetical protein